MNLAEDVALEEFVMAKDEPAARTSRRCARRRGSRARSDEVTHADFSKAKEKVPQRRGRARLEGMFM